ncbi:MAG TPA: hypothetical protein VLF43_03190 [Candidatus Saccharimonadales bacterium]|nr:hypothetical protein [Candidatus Saccharimonadales bacterium]
MKQKDIALIIIMVFVSAVVALTLSKFVFAKPADRQQTAEKVDAITADFPQPPSKYFNNGSVNPTQQIEIGNSSNPNPFNKQQP